MALKYITDAPSSPTSTDTCHVGCFESTMVEGVTQLALFRSRDTIFTIPFLRPQRVGIFGLKQFFWRVWMDGFGSVKMCEIQKGCTWSANILGAARSIKTGQTWHERQLWHQPCNPVRDDTGKQHSTTIKARVTMRRTVIPYHSLNIISQDLFKINRKSSKMILHVKPSNTNKLLWTKKPLRLPHLCYPWPCFTSP